MSRLHLRRGPRAFTLIELTVSLVAGLIVALGILALSREATRTFNEEVRGAAAEATLRTAVDRLRADLQRAGYMSTANVALDPMIAKPLTQPTNIPKTAPLGIQKLASIYLNAGGSLTANALAQSSVQTPALTPDSFDIGGNLSTAEQFEVQMIVPPTTGCTRVLLSTASSAMYRIAVAGLGSAAATAELRNAFQPVPAGMTTQFMVRLVDSTGHVQYLATCKNATAASFNGTQPYVDLDTSTTPLVFASQTGTVGGISGYCEGCFINPVQLVRWEITTTKQEQAHTAQYAVALANLSTNTIDPLKYDLIRTYLDATDSYVYETSEVVAEYAVDLKLAFSVETTALGDQQPSISTLTFDDSTNANWAKDVTTTATVNVGPQRIRSARVRLVTRAAQSDRSVNVPLGNFGAQTFMYRYCVNASPSCATNDGTLRWARARTVTAEVSFHNTAQDFF
jgi:Tfp pilus assembly protein PilW